MPNFSFPSIFRFMSVTEVAAMLVVLLDALANSPVSEALAALGVANAANSAQLGRGL
jgi:hypothetical protein